MTIVSNVYGSGTTVPLVPQVDPIQLREWAMRMEKTVNDLVTMVTRHESTISLLHVQLKTVEAMFDGAKDFIKYVEEVHPKIYVEYCLTREASERLTT